MQSLERSETDRKQGSCEPPEVGCFEEACVVCTLLQSLALRKVLNDNSSEF